MEASNRARATIEELDKAAAIDWSKYYSANAASEFQVIEKTAPLSAIEAPIALKLAHEVIESSERYPAAWKGDSANEKVILAHAVVKLSATKGISQLVNDDHERALRKGERNG